MPDPITYGIGCLVAALLALGVGLAFLSGFRSSAISEWPVWTGVLTMFCIGYAYFTHIWLSVGIGIVLSFVGAGLMLCSGLLLVMADTLQDR